MQRIGRVDRRMNPEIEARIIADHPELQGSRGKVSVLELPAARTNWTNSCASSSASPTRRCSSPAPWASKAASCSPRMTSSIPQGIQRAMRRHAHGCRVPAPGIPAPGAGSTPNWRRQLADLPLKVFSRQGNVRSQAVRAVFFCYRIPRPDRISSTPNRPATWSDTAGLTVWYLYDLEGNACSPKPAAIASLIRSTPETPRHSASTATTLVRTAQARSRNTSTDIPEARCKPRWGEADPQVLDGTELRVAMPMTTDTDFARIKTFPRRWSATCATNSTGRSRIRLR